MAIYVFSENKKNIEKIKLFLADIPKPEDKQGDHELRALTDKVNGIQKVLESLSSGSGLVW